MSERNISITGFSDLNIFIQKETIHKRAHTVDNKLHSHTQYEMLVNLRGDEHVIIGKNIYPITHGDAILVRPHEQHHCVMKSENTHEIFWILIDVKPESSIAVFLDSLKSNYFSPSGQDREELIRLCDKLKSENLGELETLKAFLEIMELLKKSVTTTDNAESKLPTELNAALEYIDAHISEEFKISDVAHRLGMSESTLSRRFGEFLGASPLEYLKKRRMIRAAELLRNGESVLEAGLAVGYSDNSYFIKLFKSYYGTTPLKYKEKAIRN